MPSTDRRLELKAKDIDGSDRLTAGCVCQWVNGMAFPVAIGSLAWSLISIGIIFFDISPGSSCTVHILMERHSQWPLAALPGA